MSVQTSYVRRGVVTTALAAITLGVAVVAPMATAAPDKGNATDPETTSVNREITGTLLVNGDLTKLVDLKGITQLVDGLGRAIGSPRTVALKSEVDTPASASTPACTGARATSTSPPCRSGSAGRPETLVLLNRKSGRVQRVDGLQAICWTPDGTRLLARRTASPTSSDLVLVDPAKTDQPTQVGNLPNLVIYSGTWLRGNP